MTRKGDYRLTAEALEYARQRYEKTNDPMSAIAAELQSCSGTLYRIAKAQGWQLRMNRPPRGLSEALKLDIQATQAVANEPSEPCQAADGNPAPDAPAADTVAARLEAAVEKELREVEELRRQSPARGKRSAESQRIARTLATLTETLFKVRRLRDSGKFDASHDDDLPSDPDGFRLALARRIDLFVHSRMDKALSGQEQPKDSEPAGS
jgi:hypothetical protein